MCIEEVTNRISDNSMLDKNVNWMHDQGTEYPRGIDNLVEGMIVE